MENLSISWNRMVRDIGGLLQRGQGGYLMARTAAGFAAGVLAVLAIQHAVYFHLQRIHVRGFRSTA